MIVLSLGVVVIIMQMLAISILSSEPPPKLPWSDDAGGGAHRDTRGGVGLSIQPPLQQVCAACQAEGRGGGADGSEGGVCAWVPIGVRD